MCPLLFLPLILGWPLLLAAGLGFLTAWILARRWPTGWCLLVGLGVAGLGQWSASWVVPVQVVAVPVFALTLVAGLVLAQVWIDRRIQAAGFDRYRVMQGGLLALGAGLVGARLHYLAEFGLEGRSFLAALVRFDEGGMVVYGAFLAAVPVVWWWSWRSGWSRRRIGDLVFPPLLVALAIGRLGCLANGCCYGQPTNLPWGVQPDQPIAFDLGIPAQAKGGHDAFLVRHARAIGRPAEAGVTRHPVAGYEAMVVLLLLLLLVTWERRAPAPGRILAVGLIGYGLWRVGAERLRADNLPVLAGLTPSALISLGLAGLGAALLRRPPSPLAAGRPSPMVQDGTGLP